MTTHTLGVYEIAIHEIGELEFTATYEEQHSFKSEEIILASNSLIKLKKEIKRRHVKLAWLQCEHGSFSYGQNVVDEYPYRPRY